MSGWIFDSPKPVSELVTKLILNAWIGVAHAWGIDPKGMTSKEIKKELLGVRVETLNPAALGHEMAVSVFEADLRGWRPG